MDGEKRGNISVIVRTDYVRLLYTWTPSDGIRRRFDYQVWVERTSCHFGGTRPWFRCPRCQMRRAVVYGIAGDGRFGCRACMRLAYSSEAEGLTDRMSRKQQKLEGRLDQYGDRPKGMRRGTYARLCQGINDIEEKKVLVFTVRAMSMLGLTSDLDGRQGQ